VTRAPALSLAVVLTLALGLGANLTMYGIVDRLLLTPPPHTERPGELRRLMVEQYQEWRGERSATDILSYPDFAQMTASSRVADAAVWQEQRLTLGQGAAARQIDGAAVSGNYFALRGVRPALGRLLQPADDDVAAERAAVISHAMWQRDFGGASDVVGRTLALGGEAVYTIVGVAPRGMTSLRLAAIDVWLPLRKAVTQDVLDSPNWHGFGAVVRLHEAAAAPATMEEMSLRLRRGRAEHIAAGRFDADARALLTPLLEALGPTARPEARVARWLAGVSLVVLLVACVNVANLLLARMVRQRREIAVRLALGISRRRLIGQLLLEGTLLGLAGGAAALLIAHWVGSALGSILLPDVAWQELGWTPLLPVFAVAAAVTAGLAAAVVPALHAARPDLSDALRQGGVGGLTRGTARTRTALSLAQAALSVVLLVGAGLFVRSLDAVRDVDLGYRLDQLLYVETSFMPGTTTPEERLAIRQEVLSRLRAHPAVAIAAEANTAPFMWSMSNNVKLPGRDSLPLIGTGAHWFYTVSPGYFDVLGTRVLRGRAFDERDVTARENVALVNETMARALWPGRDAIGECMLVGSEECTYVIGVVPDTRQRHFQEEPSAQYFVPLTPDHIRQSRIVLLRPAPGVQQPRDALRAAAASVDPRIRYVSVESARERFEPQERSWRVGATLFSVFGALALAVAALGLYAVLAFDVQQRTREIGVRSALGAGRARIVGMIVTGALRVAALGILLGALAASALAPRLGDMLFETSPHDPLIYGAVALALLAVATTAALLPARRAASVDPNVALRAE
jgi:predicted permease